MIRNTKSSYGWISIGFHWLMAMAVMGLFGLGLYMVELGYYDSWYRSSMDLHKSIGLILAFVYVCRLLWNWSQSSPMVIADKAWQALAAKLIHRLLYLLLVAIMCSGYLISTADGRSIEIFGLVSVPALPFSFEQQEDIAGFIHWCLAWGLMILVALHAAAALQHHFILKDNTLKRMLKPN